MHLLHRARYHYPEVSRRRTVTRSGRANPPGLADRARRSPILDRFLVRRVKTNMPIDGVGRSGPNHTSLHHDRAVKDG